MKKRKDGLSVKTEKKCQMFVEVPAACISQEKLCAGQKKRTEREKIDFSFFLRQILFLIVLHACNEFTTLQCHDDSSKLPTTFACLSSDRQT